MYTGFAEVYDELMSDVDYAGWAQRYAGLLAARGISRGKVCECACGTGSLTLPLQRLGYTMTGVDLSQDMLWIASQKARAQGLAIPFVRQDMRRLLLHRPMDAVLATCDGVNYLTQDADALAFFRAAYGALRPGGALIFDVSTSDKLRETLGDRVLCEDTERVTYIWQNSWNEKKQQVRLHLCIFIREKDGRYRRIDEDQTQRAYDRQTLEALLAEAGFRQISFCGNSAAEPPGPGEQRWHIAATRPEEEPT